MSKVGELALKALVTATRRSRSKPGTDTSDDWESYIRWQFESSAVLFAKYPRFNLKGLRVLEIGCGTGGRASYLGGLGAESVVAIDINASEIDIAREYCPKIYPSHTKNVEFVVSRENEPLNIGVFDIVLLVDCLEHVRSPAHMLQLGYGYTTDGGKCYFSNIGWYNHFGSHLGLFPFDNLFFSDETLINVMRWYVSRPEYVPSRFDSNPPIARWKHIYDLRDRPGEHLNKLTVGEMKTLLKYSPFRKSHMEVVGFGGRHPIFQLTDPLRYLPLIQEVYHSLIIAECER
ncbi:MAG TPA: class I SAM-dependent methyltransferase [Polyangiaceae bacterium]